MSGRGVSPFDRLIKQQCQKGAAGAISASKSAGLVGRWGSASFTSLRGAKNNGAASGSSEGAAVASAPRPKKFFKSRTAAAAIPAVDEVCEAIVPESSSFAGKRPGAPLSASVSASTSAPAPPKKNKFFTSKHSSKAPSPQPQLFAASAVSTSAARPATPEEHLVPKEEQKKIPPLKLKIKVLPPAPPPDPAPAAPSARPSRPRRGTRKPATSESSSSSSVSEADEDDKEEEEEAHTPTVESKKDVEMREDETDDIKVGEYGIQEETEVSVPAPARVDRTDDIKVEEASVSVPAPSRPAVRSYGRNRSSASKPPSAQTRSTMQQDLSLLESTLEKGVIHTLEKGVIQENLEVSFKSVAAVKEEEEEEDPEISFKDDSLVIKSPNSKAVETSSSTTTAKESYGKDKTQLGPRTVSEPGSVPGKATLPAVKEESTSEDVFTAPVSRSSSQPAIPGPSTSSTSSASISAAGPSGQAGPPRRRGAIFKSKRTNGAAEGKKGLSLYKHKWNAGPVETEEDFRKEVVTRAVLRGLPPEKDSLDFDDPDDGDGRVPPLHRRPTELPPTDMSFAASKLTRVASAPPGRIDETFQEVVSVKCPKEQKDYYMVIKNVKKAHQIQDSGEFQEFNDDVDYILGGLGAKNGLSTRCLSTVTLASKCMEPGFRMHLRAHGTVTQFFSELRDSPKNPALALCASTVLFVLSQDRLNMDLDRDSLELMLNLLDTDSKIKDALDSSGMNERELEKNKQKVQDLVAAMKQKGHAVTLSLDLISADHLAMETLLSLTSKRAGEWFKEELRDLGGLDHLVNTFSECVTILTADDLTSWTDQLHDKLRKADRVLKVLENVTHENEENCMYLLRHREGEFLQTVHKLFRLLDEEVPLNPSTDMAADRDSVAHSLRDSTFDVIRVYINLVHDYQSTPFGSAMAGKLAGLFDTTMHCLFVLPESMPQEKRFDVLVLALTLLINLVENCIPNRESLIKCFVPDRADTFTAASEKTPAYAGLVRMFLDKEESARQEESKTNNILDGVKEEDEEEKKEEPKSQEERIEETVAKLLHKAGRHMEDTLIGSYITLIIGYLILDDKDRELQVREHLPDNNFSVMVAVLKKFFNFMNLTASATLTSSRGLKATETIIKYLEKIDKSEEEKGEDDAAAVKAEENFDDLTVFDVSKDDEEDGSSFSMDRSGFLPDDEFGKL